MNAPAIQSIPLDRLSLSSHNARKTGGDNVTDLIASIRANGLLQNLIVTPGADGHFDVVAGGRRLRALQKLQLTGDLPEALEQVPCQVILNGQVAEASTAENVVRERMHPADEFEAFRAMVEGGKPIEDVAAHFGVTRLVVERRLKLANVAPEILAEFRTGNANRRPRGAEARVV